MGEIQRIKKAYAKRDCLRKGSLYTFFNPSSLYISQQREREILKALIRFGIRDITDKNILDLGCGTGGVLRDFLKYGARSENCHGIDLLPDRIETAKSLSPNIDFICGNAEALPHANEFFDIILCFTVFTSIFDKGMKQNLSREMLRVLKHDGIILYYDYHVNNPRNPDVQGVKKAEIHELFPNCKIDLKRITLAPPLARAIAPISVIACQILEKIPLLCTHYLGVIKKR